MGRKSDGSWVEETLGDMIVSGSTLRAYCGDRLRCGRELDLDVYDLAMLFGTRARTTRARFPLRCATCRCREIHYIHAPDARIPGYGTWEAPTNFRETRPAKERAALLLVFRWERQG